MRSTTAKTTTHCSVGLRPSCKLVMTTSIPFREQKLKYFEKFTLTLYTKKIVKANKIKKKKQ